MSPLYFSLPPLFSEHFYLIQFLTPMSTPSSILLSPTSRYLLLFSPFSSLPIFCRGFLLDFFFLSNSQSLPGCSILFPHPASSWHRGHPHIREGYVIGFAFHSAADLRLSTLHPQLGFLSTSCLLRHLSPSFVLILLASTLHVLCFVLFPCFCFPSCFLSSKFSSQLLFLSPFSRPITSEYKHRCLCVVSRGSSFFPINN